MILLDTHIWVWWANGAPDLSYELRDALNARSVEGIGVSHISCWEVALKVAAGKLELDRPISSWLSAALTLPGVRPIELTLPILLESTQLPGAFHRDPADRMLVATARLLDIELLTADTKILDYEHVPLMRH